MPDAVIGADPVEHHRPRPTAGTPSKNLDIVCQGLLRHPVSAFPFDAPTANAAVGSSNSDWAGFGLDVASAVTQFVWATIDVGLEMISYDSGEPSPFDNQLLDFFTLIDILCPAIITIFQWPVPPTYTGTQTPAPFHYDDQGRALIAR